MRWLLVGSVFVLPFSCSSDPVASINELMDGESYVIKYDSDAVAIAVQPGDQMAVYCDPLGDRWTIDGNTILGPDGLVDEVDSFEIGLHSLVAVIAVFEDGLEGEPTAVGDQGAVEYSVSEGYGGGKIQLRVVGPEKVSGSWTYGDGGGGHVFEVQPGDLASVDC